MTIRKITNYLESIAPLKYQESYDNAGLIVGNPSVQCTKALLCLDSTEAVIDEAIEKGCNLVIAHHPIVFSGLKKITGRNYIERVIIKAIKNDIAIYAAHTNLDNVHNGVNRKIAEKLGLQNCRILAPKKDALLKLDISCPIDHADQFRKILLKAGGNHVLDFGISSFNTLSIATPKQNTSQTATLLITLAFPAHLEGNMLNAIKHHHPSPQPTYHLQTLKNKNQHLGAGMIGQLRTPMDLTAFLGLLQNKMNVACVRHTRPLKQRIQKVAVCGGSGSFLLPKAISAGADIFVTADYKYHQFFDADKRIVIADIGHYESEQFTIELFQEIISKKFPNFVAILSKVNTNPVHYFVG
ncbi:MAG: Nif3-like dinuclear metal center hexameric protein [Chitinophagales bacterium]